MKKSLALVVALMFVLAIAAGCGASVPEEKYLQVEELYGQLAADYTAIYEAVVAMGDQSIIDIVVNDIGAPIKEYGNAIASELADMSEEEVDALIEQLEGLNSQISDLMAQLGM